MLDPQSGIEPTPSAVKAQSLKHWTSREFLDKGVEWKQARGDRGPAEGRVKKEILGLEERTETSTQRFYWALLHSISATLSSIFDEIFSEIEFTC